MDGINFSAPLARSIRRGEKTKTRRLLKMEGIMGGRFPVLPPERPVELDDGEHARGIWHYASTDALSGPYNLKFKLGETRYIREPWATAKRYDGHEVGDLTPSAPIHYIIDCSAADLAKIGRRRSSDMMRPWASRMNLTITGLRLVQLQDMTNDDARAMGITCIDGKWGLLGAVAFRHPSPVAAYASLWSVLRTIKGAGWLANPWVIELDFTTEETR